MDRDTEQKTFSPSFFELRAKETEMETAPSHGKKSERGIVLVVVLVLSAVALALITALIYMITSGTQISGLQKRYKTSLEAARGGSDLAYKLVGLRGDEADTAQFLSDTAVLNPSIPLLGSSCTGTSQSGTPYTKPLQAKLLTPTTLWGSNCDRSLSIDPGNPATYDMKLELGTTNTYDFYAKIVNTVEGNTGPDGTGGGGTGLINKGVVSSGVGEIQVMQKPYLYAMEVVATSSTNTNERSKFSILYQY
jgi:hypothetical protein